MKTKSVDNPRQRRPIGRKMWTSDDVGSAPNICCWKKESGVFKQSPVLVLSLDPANVERIKETVTDAIYCLYVKKYGTIKPYPRSSYLIYTEAIMLALGLTPAKRRGK